jgi:hypothetical protein
MSEDDRKSFDNLIFLCVAHHKTVDERGAESKYSIELLRKWKADREAGAPERLRGLRDVTEEKLVTMISSAIQQRDDDITRTLDRLEKTDSEAAALIRELREELVAARRHGSLINSDVVGMLDRAASNLANLEDNAASLNRAASYLINLEGYVDQIQNAANSLRNAAMQAADLNRFH